MKFATLACLACWSAFAFGRVHEIPSLPTSLYADTEVATNIAFNAVRDDVRSFDVRMDLTGFVSNNVQIAFGRDLDGDGDLAPDETGLVMGWRGGRYFLEDVAGCSRLFETNVSETAEGRFLQMNVATGPDFAPRGAAFTNELGACFAEVSSAVPPWLFRRGWNLLKVTRRGAVPADEWCRVQSRYSTFHVVIR